MKKTTFAFCFIFFLNLICLGQVPSVQWLKTLGGTGIENAYSIQQTTDGGYIVSGNAASSNGDVTGNHGGPDFWAVRLDNMGEIKWQKSLGGTATDVSFAVQQTIDGGFILAGQSSSNNGDVTGHHGSTSNDDFWIVKIDTVGTIQWQKSLGGSGYDMATSIKQTTDKGYIIAGGSSSNDGDVTGHHGLNYDYWVVKIDSLGTIQWEKSLGGTDSEIANKVCQTKDGGYIVVGASNSTDGDISSNHSSTDSWIVKLDSIGIIQWEKSLGGSQTERADDVKQTIDGGYIVGGTSSSNDGDVTGNHGLGDYWIVKLDTLGIIQWQKSYGGTGDEQLLSIQETIDGGFILGGSSDSINGDVLSIHIRDYWLLKTDTMGVIEWQVSLGGSYADGITSLQQTSDNGYVLAGSTYSTDGDVIGNHGSGDFWVVKLSPQANNLAEKFESKNYNIFPNPIRDVFNVEFLIKNGVVKLEIENLLGQIVYTIQTNKSINTINTSNLPSGVYLLKVYNADKILLTQKIIKE